MSIQDLNIIDSSYKFLLFELVPESNRLIVVKLPKEVSHYQIPFLKTFKKVTELLKRRVYSYKFHLRWFHERIIHTHYRQMFFSHNQQAWIYISLLQSNVFQPALDRTEEFISPLRPGDLAPMRYIASFCFLAQCLLQVVDR